MNVDVDDRRQTKHIKDWVSLSSTKINLGTCKHSAHQRRSVVAPQHLLVRHLRDPPVAAPDRVGHGRLVALLEHVEVLAQRAQRGEGGAQHVARAARPTGRRHLAADGLRLGDVAAALGVLGLHAAGRGAGGERPGELHRARVAVEVRHDQPLADCRPAPEGWRCERHLRRPDDCDRHAGAPVRRHEREERDAAEAPLGGRRGEAVRRGHVGGRAGADQRAGRVAERVAEVGVEGGGHRGARLVAEVEADGREARVRRGPLGGGGGGRAPLAQLDAHELREQPLRLDLRELRLVVGGLPLEHQLAADVGRQAREQRGRGRREERQDGRVDLVAVGGGVAHPLAVLERGRDLAEQRVDLRDVLDEPLGDEHDAKVLPLGRARLDGVGQLTNDVAERHAARLELLAHQRDVWLREVGAREGEVGGRAAHHADEVPVLASGGGVGGEVAHEGGVHARGGVEADGRLDRVAVQVAVDGGGDADDARRDAALLEVLRQQRRVRVGDGAAHEDEPAQPAPPAGRLRQLVVLRRANDIRRAAEQVHPAAVEVRRNLVRAELDGTAAEQAARPVEEAEQLGALAAAPLQEVGEPDGDVVRAGALAAAKDDADD
mmetsp:Transcript_45082/g.146751  ORF Transcript_45082/g.146751 Transcript_45082/m.146751 type:complete len:605 (+) Transcript_45082:49-1863(+)